MHSGEIQFEDLGRLAYAPAFEKQCAIHADVLAGKRPPTVLLVEHDPVITVSRRQSAAAHVLADAAMLARHGVALCPTDRGGDVTYHGPGQLVIYPILPLNTLGLNIRRYVRGLEAVVIRALTTFGVVAQRDHCATGVWVQDAKVAAIGVRVQCWVSMHGMAINVDPQMAHYDLIVPCGLNRPVTSLKRLLGDDCPSMDQVKQSVTEAFGAITEG